MKLRRNLILILISCVSYCAIAQVKIGVITMQRLNDTMPSMKVALDKYQAHAKTLQEELVSMKGEYDKLIADYQAKYNDLTPVLRQASEKRILEKERQLQDRQEATQAELQAFREELNAPIVDRIKKAIATIAERQKLSVVIDQTSTLYFTPELDITDAVAVELLKLEKDVK